MNVKYIVKPKEKICICIIDECEMDAYAKCTVDLWYTDIENLMMPNSFKGIARCADVDTFDEQTGKRIAFNKAYNKYMKSFIKALRRQNKDMQRQIDTVENIIQNTRKFKNYK